MPYFSFILNENNLFMLGVLEGLRISRIMLKRLRSWPLPLEMRADINKSSTTWSVMTVRVG